MKSILLSLLAVISHSVFAQWINTKGPYGSGTWCLYSNKQVLYVGGSGGAHSSSDHGRSWKNISIPGNMTVMSFAGNDSFIFAASQQGIYRSADQGNTWKQAWKSDPQGSIPYLFTHGTDIYANLRDTLYRSSDNGRSWKHIGGNLIIGTNSMVFRDSFIFAACQDAVYRSSDRGGNWQKVLNQANTRYMAQKDSFILFANPYGIFRSTDNGDQWSNMPFGISQDNVRHLYAYEGKLYAAGSKGPLISGDDGQTWSLFRTGITDFYTQAVVFAHTDSFLFVAADHRIYKYDKIQASWQDMTNNINDNSIQVMYASDSVIYASSWFGGLWYSSDLGNSWKDLGGIHSPYGIGTLVKRGDTLFAGRPDRFILSVNNGQSWVEKPSAITTAGIRSMYGWNNRIYTSTGDGLYVSTNYGNQWTLAGGGLPKLPISSFQVNDKLLVASTGQGVYISRDGKTWTRKNDSFNTSDSRVLYTALNDTFICIATAGNMVYLSKDAGNSWQKISNSLDSVIFTSVMIRGKYILAGTGGHGVYMTEDEGQIWKPVRQGLPALTWVNDLAQSGHYIYAGTTGRGLWLRRTEEIFTDLRSPSASHTLSFYPNPLPAGQSLFLATGQDMASTSTYCIYHINGQKLHEGIADPGGYLFNNDLPSGIYFIEIRTGNAYVRGKLVVE